MTTSQPAQRARRMPRQPSEPLLRSGHSLILSSVVTSSIGLAFWVLAAHRYRPSVVGADAVALTTLAFLSGVAQLNLAGALTRFVPVAGTKRGRFIVGSYAASAAVSTVLSIAFLCFATRISPSFAFLRGSLRVEAWWVISAIAWGVFVLEDGALVGLRRSRWVPIENAAFSIIKLVLVVALASLLRRSGIFYAWTIATVATVIPLNFYLFTRAVPEEAVRAPEGDVSIAHLARYVPCDYLAA
ncbi:MAG TPA: hypothetical protein VG368_06555, partial [Acidimicrobiales bacterium]|nr:hypothetical protein [Acidimicrobiales bacterium]